jgi:hypothetical protein
VSGEPPWIGKELAHPLDHPQLVAKRDRQMVGVLTYVVDNPACEILTLHADHRHLGVGTALIEASSG